MAAMATIAMPNPISCFRQNVSVGWALRISHAPKETIPIANTAISQSKSRTVRFSKTATIFLVSLSHRERERAECSLLTHLHRDVFFRRDLRLSRLLIIDVVNRANRWRAKSRTQPRIFD